MLKCVISFFKHIRKKDSFNYIIASLRQMSNFFLLLDKRQKVC